MRRRFTVLLGSVWLVSSLVGCAGLRRAAPPPHQPIAIAPPPAPSDATGVWDWSFRSRDDQNDERFEQEEWHLSQRGTAIEGYYDRVVDMRSLDDRLFRCNQKVSFLKYTRVRIAGVIAGNRVKLHEVAFDAKPGPCDDGARNLVAYQGVLEGGNLALSWGPQAGQTLVRRVGDGPRTALVDLVPPGDSSGGMVTRTAAESSTPVDGTWQWELRSIDADGDERTEQEEWHLTETADGIRGYYDRTVKRERGDGTFTCNHTPSYETATRYTVVGQRFGDRVMLTETEYKADKSPCDNALRRLDTYQGHVEDPDTLVLSWGPGNQLLRRIR
ncbi:MAG: hypothetical protein ACHQ17_11070 [Polyangia bacterium]